MQPHGKCRNHLKCNTRAKHSTREASHASTRSNIPKQEVAIQRRRETRQFTDTVIKMLAAMGLSLVQALSKNVDAVVWKLTRPGFGTVWRSFYQTSENLVPCMACRWTSLDKPLATHFTSSKHETQHAISLDMHRFKQRKQSGTFKHGPTPYHDSGNRGMRTVPEASEESLKT